MMLTEGLCWWVHHNGIVLKSLWKQHNVNTWVWPDISRRGNMEGCLLSPQPPIPIVAYFQVLTQYNGPPIPKVTYFPLQSQNNDSAYINNVNSLFVTDHSGADTLLKKTVPPPTLPPPQGHIAWTLGEPEVSVRSKVNRPLTARLSQHISLWVYRLKTWLRYTVPGIRYGKIVGSDVC